MLKFGYSVIIFLLREADPSLQALVNRRRRHHHHHHVVNVIKVASKIRKLLGNQISESIKSTA